MLAEYVMEAKTSKNKPVPIVKMIPVFRRLVSLSARLARSPKNITEIKVRNAVVKTIFKAQTLSTALQLPTSKPSKFHLDTDNTKISPKIVRPMACTQKGKSFLEVKV